MPCVACVPSAESLFLSQYGREMLMLMVQPEVAEQVRQAQHRRTVRLHAAGKPQPEGPQQLRHVVHISTDMRKVWIGDAEGDRTQGGLHPMDFAKVSPSTRLPFTSSSSSRRGYWKLLRPSCCRVWMQADSV